MVFCLIGSPNPSSFRGGLEYLISLGKDSFLLARKLRVACHVSNRAVEPDRVVMIDVLCYCMKSIIKLAMLSARMQPL